jgi:hypothetical protein
MSEQQPDVDLFAGMKKKKKKKTTSTESPAAASTSDLVVDESIAEDFSGMKKKKVSYCFGGSDLFSIEEEDCNF